jgi:hypothetical protein
MPDPHAARSTSGTGATKKQGLRGLVTGRLRKGVVALVLAFLAGIGLAMTNWVRDRGEEATTKVISSLSGGPIDVRVVSSGDFVSGHPFAPYYVIPRDRVASPTALGEARLARIANQGTLLGGAWVERHGGVPGSPQVIRLELSGKSDRKVTITGLRPRVLSSGPPMKGWYVTSPGCGAQPVRIADLDLDAPRPVRGFFDEGGRRRHLALTVTRTDREQLELHASTRRALVRWRAEIFYSSADGTGSVLVPEGEPFMVTAETASDGFRPDFASRPPSLAREPGWDEGITAC